LHPGLGEEEAKAGLVIPRLPDQSWMSWGSDLHWGDVGNQPMAMGSQGLASLPRKRKTG
jgi:hypothetical protein